MPAQRIAPSVVLTSIRAGMRAADVARNFAVSRERVRQIWTRETGLPVPRVQRDYQCRCGGAYKLVDRPAHTTSRAHQTWVRNDRIIRFWAHTERSGACWEWQGVRDPQGYGKAGRFVKGSGDYAHRAAYILVKGPIPDGLTIDHLCRNKSCVNPNHLEAVTQRENVLRSPIAPAAVNARKTHCPQGHPYAGENLKLTGQGRHRECRACHREREQRRRAVA